MFSGYFVVPPKSVSNRELEEVEILISNLNTSCDDAISARHSKNESWYWASNDNAIRILENIKENKENCYLYQRDNLFYSLVKAYIIFTNNEYESAGMLARDILKTFYLERRIDIFEYEKFRNKVLRELS